MAVIPTMGGLKQKNDKFQVSPKGGEEYRIRWYVIKQN
jgi:hypothetical protein